MKKPKYWRGIEELNQTPEFLESAKHEFPTDVPFEDTLSNTTDEKLGFKANRRDFLKIMGFGMTAATLSACAEAPLKKVIPYVNKPDDIIPGVANWYASTTPEGTPVLVKTREGRPIKFEGNPDSPLTEGVMDAVGHSQVLGVYDIDRLQYPLKGANPVSWTKLDNTVKTKLQEIKANGGKVRVVTGSVLSPTTKAAVGVFAEGFEDFKHISFDAVSSYATAKSHEMNFGRAAIPSYYFEKADVIVGFSCDFLGSWIGGAEYSAKYIKNRDPKKGHMSRHFQFESNLTVTGGMADLRFPIKPSEEGIALLNLYNKVAKKMGGQVIPGVKEFNVAMNGLDKVAAELVAAQGKSLVVCGSNDVNTQQVVNAINYMLGNYGETIDLNNPSYFRQGNDEEMAALVAELDTVDAVFFYDCNPAYSSPFAEEISKKLAKVPLSVAMTYKTNETSELCQYTAASSHFLESWSDAQQTATHYSIVQPTINPIFDTRQPQDSFLKWAGSDQAYYDMMRAWWKETLFDGNGSFDAFWDETVRSGVKTVPGVPSALSSDVAPSFNLVSAGRALMAESDKAGEGTEVVLYTKLSIGDGTNANNPWLQEMPDPITRTVWDNYITVPYSDAEEMGISNEDVLEVSVDGKSIKLPAVVQPGQARGTIGIALGYGRTSGGRVIKNTGGKNAYPLVSLSNGTMDYTLTGASITKTGDTYPLALTQTFNTLYDPVRGASSGNDYDRTEHIIKETTLGAYIKDPYAGNEHREAMKQHLVTLWDSHFEDKETNKYIRWAMAVDMNKCTGCGACVVSCSVENNVPVVGKEEVRTRREMHWMRIDRYYSGEMDNPDVAFQPMMCQHCDNAPCETVCPVLATIHSYEGLNQMTYNRCVGTRYCANNCPYKVRRFNWFNYYNGEQFTDINPGHVTNPLGHFVLNPDVTVRFRGVMEKCSWCVQRLQEAKLRVKIRENSSLAKPTDDDLKTACSQSCPADAIVFGDLNDPNSKISKYYRDERGYHVLEELKVLPSVMYLTRVKNRTEEEVKFKEEADMRQRTYA
ncbi:MAG: TAT-variant-translocated molybdopterin oxidoreductase [Bacteroidota bacterium]